MLNYIWMSLIVLGIGVAVYTDVRDQSRNRYFNGARIPCVVAEPGVSGEGDTPSASVGRTILIPPGGFNDIYGTNISDTLAVTIGGAPGSAAGGAVTLPVDANTPAIWREIAEAQRNPDRLRATLGKDDAGGWVLTTDEVVFVRLNAVTNDGIIRYAKVAVELAIGLIGIMSLWLGLMKIAEKSGMVAALSSALRPATKRLFPDVPPDHPAVGAMLMNISANMLGLANAATPLGLKAMEELNRLNKKVGTATDAMCTFLVINTSSVQLIPATVIAIRAAAGSSNPTEIIGPVLLATGISTVVGVTAVRLLSRLPVFRRQLAGGGEPA